MIVTTGAYCVSMWPRLCISLSVYIPCLIRIVSVVFNCTRNRWWFLHYLAPCSTFTSRYLCFPDFNVKWFLPWTSLQLQSHVWITVTAESISRIKVKFTPWQRSKISMAKQLASNHVCIWENQRTDIVIHYINRLEYRLSSPLSLQLFRLMYFFFIVWVQSLCIESYHTELDYIYMENWLLAAP